MAKINYGGLDTGCGLEIYNADEALQVKSLVRQSRRLRPREWGGIDKCTARGHLKNKKIQNGYLWEGKVLS